MERYSIDSINKDRSYYKAIDIAKSKILNGKLIIIPTDTIYCFCCLHSSKKTVTKISQIKGLKPKEVSDYLYSYTQSVGRVSGQNNIYGFGTP